MKKIFITGGSGALGSVLVNHLKNNYNVLSPSSDKCNILDLEDLSFQINNFSPEIVIHLAAFVDTFGCEKNIHKAIDTNIMGTINLVKSTLNLKCKVVYISSEYVFKGDKGNYTIKDKLDPINVYGKTKASSEHIVSILNDHQIIRVPFIKKVYPKVFKNQYCSRYFLDEIPEKIINNIMHNTNTIVHISSDRSSLLNKYKEKGYFPTPINIPNEYKNLIPKDTSLIDNSIENEK